MMISLSWAKMKPTCLSWCEWRNSIRTWEAFTIAQFCVCLEKLLELFTPLCFLCDVPHNFQTYWYSLHCHLFMIRFFSFPVSSHSSWNMLTNKLVMLLIWVARGTLGVWINGQRAGKVQKKVSAFFQICFLHKCVIQGTFSSFCFSLHLLLHSKVTCTTAIMVALFSGLIF